MKESKNGILVFRLGSPMNIMIRIMGVIMQLMGLYKVVDYPLVAILVFALGCFATYQWQGVEIDKKKKQFRSYTSLLGIKRGEWLGLDKFPYLTILKRSTVERVYGQSMAGYDHTKAFYSIVLMNESHRTKYVLKNIQGLEEAKKEAQIIAAELEKPLVSYSPKISQTAHARRRR